MSESSEESLLSDLSDIPEMEDDISSQDIHQEFEYDHGHSSEDHSSSLPSLDGETRPIDNRTLRLPSLLCRRSNREPQQLDDDTPCLDESSLLPPVPRRIWSDTSIRCFDGNSQAESTASSQRRSSLFEDIFKINSTRLNPVVEGVVDKWIRKYKNENTSETALAEVLELFLHLAGCTGRLQQDKLVALSYDIVVRGMSSEAENSRYPLERPYTSGKRFYEGLSLFLEILMEKCKSSIVFDGKLVKSISNFLIAMASSQLLAFRHSGTLAALKLISALASMVIQRTFELERNQQIKQLERRSLLSDEESQASVNCDILNDDLQELKRVIKYNFENIFERRYRDCFFLIRIACIIELEVWMTSYLSVFENVQFHRYIKPLLLDKIKACVKVSVVMLKSLFQRVHSNAPSFQTPPNLESLTIDSKMLEDFTIEFKKVIIGIAHLKTGCCLDAIKLLNCMQKCHPHLILSADAEAIYRLLLSLNRDIAKEAGKFLNERLMYSTEKKASNCTQTRNERVLRALVRVCLKFGLYSDIRQLEIFVDSSIDSIAVLTDWQTMCEVLKKFSKEISGHSEEKSFCLVDLIVTSMTRVSTCHPPKWLTADPKKPKVKESNMAAKHKQSFSDILCQTLPQLLAAYKTRAEMIAKLFAVVPLLDLNCNTASRQARLTNNLLVEVNEIVECNPETLNVCAKALAILGCPTSAVHVACQENVDEHVSSLVRECNNLSISYQEMGMDEDALLQRLLLLDDLLKNQKAISANSLENLIVLIDHCCDKVNVQVLRVAINCCKSYFMWHFSTENRNDGNEDRLMRHFKKFLLLCLKMMYSRNKEIQEKGFIMTGALLQICFKTRKTYLTSHKNFVELVTNGLVYFIQIRVFRRRPSNEDSDNSGESLLENRSFLTVFSHLIVMGITHYYYATFLVSHLLEREEYEDVIIATVKGVKNISLAKCGKLIVNSLYQSFDEVRTGKEKNISRCKAFLSLKNFANKLEGLLGTEFYKSRVAVVKLHRKGIQLCTKGLGDHDPTSSQPPKILFLDVLIKFTQNITAAMKKEILAILDNDCLPVEKFGEVGELWSNYLAYRKKLSGSKRLPRATGGGDDVNTLTLENFRPLTSGDEETVSRIEMDSSMRMLRAKPWRGGPRKRPAAASGAPRGRRPAQSDPRKRLCSTILIGDGDLRQTRRAAKRKRPELTRGCKRPRL